MPGPLSECYSLPSAPRSVIPAKRSDDDVQFISSKPVKRRKMSEQAPKPTVQQHNISTTPTTPMPPVSIQPTELKDSDRRISTGMVGLPSDFNTMELASMLRGVSLPVLERFVLNQPSRGPRPPSSPELSPKQLPRTIAPAMLSANSNGNSPRGSRFDVAPMAYMTMGENAAQPESHSTNPLNPTSTVDQLHVFKASVVHTHPSSPMLDRLPKEADPKSLAMPPPPVPNAEILATPKSARVGSPSNNATHITTRSDTTKRPCQVCARMRQQADLAKFQGFSMFPHNVPHHMLPHIACHQPFSQHLHPQMMAMGPNSMHSLSPGFAPIMMPINSNNFTTVPTHMASPSQMPSQMKDQVHEKNSRPGHTNINDQIQPSSTSATGEAQSSTALNPVKPPASLIQPTYRKPSPNLIVDVAETCQEKFPFEDVAKRHNVPVEKVFDVFAAIIQVPLLRCPTDRRRAGKLATTRVKEYTKVKKAIQEASSQNDSDSADQIVVKPLDIANRLGQVNLPDGFNST
ncbi:uncharacterized protein F4817DRAFT_327407 [Daldinia loculata]|uniref:uncharacterized protein n=1 Tax=Daldinia loculata TaxID=103429 RepID=UPI0020C58745|nr:uncharacterized protein F4817DRAFT_327407 [Daldinia loculata]KAI1650809.1 hypothetical protein F4817DRAFT_327407 [Daldinia loculata]